MAFMNILITGSGGFIGKNLVCELKNQGYGQLCLYDVDTDPGLLDGYCRSSDFVFHLAGVNRPENTDEYMQGNAGFLSALLPALGGARRQDDIRHRLAHGGITGSEIEQAVKLATDMKKDGDTGTLPSDYKDTNVSTKVVKIIQSYTAIVNKVIWGK